MKQRALKTTFLASVLGVVSYFFYTIPQEPQVIIVGERHRIGNKVYDKDDLEFIAMMPNLVERGYKILALEQVEESWGNEIKNYNSSGDFHRLQQRAQTIEARQREEAMRRNIKWAFDPHLDIMEKAHSLGMEIIPYAVESETLTGISDDNAAAFPELNNKRWSAWNEAEYNNLLPILESGKKMVIYCGKGHILRPNGLAEIISRNYGIKEVLLD